MSLTSSLFNFGCELTPPKHFRWLHKSSEFKSLDFFLFFFVVLGTCDTGNLVHLHSPCLATVDVIQPPSFQADHFCKELLLYTTKPKKYITGFSCPVPVCGSVRMEQQHRPTTSAACQPPIPAPMRVIRLLVTRFWPPCEPTQQSLAWREIRWSFSDQRNLFSLWQILCWVIFNEGHDCRVRQMVAPSFAAFCITSSSGCSWGISPPVFLLLWGKLAVRLGLKFPASFLALINLGAVSKVKEDHNTIHGELHNLGDESKGNGMKFKTTKCKVMHLGINKKFCSKLGAHQSEMREEQKDVSV